MDTDTIFAAIRYYINSFITICIYADILDKPQSINNKWILPKDTVNRTKQVFRIVPFAYFSFFC